MKKILFFFQTGGCLRSVGRNGNYCKYYYYYKYHILTLLTNKQRLTKLTLRSDPDCLGLHFCTSTFNLELTKERLTTVLMHKQ